MSEEPVEPGVEYEIVMPFVLVATAGGPYDDEAFTSGWRLSQIREALRHDGVVWSGPVMEADLPQLDLIAMERGLVMSSAPADDDTGWVWARVGG